MINIYKEYVQNIIHKSEGNPDESDRGCGLNAIYMTVTCLLELKG